MKARAFDPVLNKVYYINEHCLLVLSSGQGIFQVDFRNYDFTSGKAIFLSPGQYFKLIAGKYNIHWYEFPTDKIKNTANTRYLFKHLVGLGYINMTQPQNYHLDQLQYLDINNRSTALLSNAIEQWLEMNPFCTSQQQTNVLFDLKEIVDDRYREPISLAQISTYLDEKPYRIQKLTKEKLQHTVYQLAKNKLLLEAQRRVVFTDHTSKEIAYDLGFNEPAYFNRFFKQNTSKTPYEFREVYELASEQTFTADLLRLINAHFREHHTMWFYANQLNISPKTLSKKVQQHLGTTVHQLIKKEIIKAAQRLLAEQQPVNEIAFNLGFKEPNHFTSFFKTHTGKNPTEYKQMFL